MTAYLIRKEVLEHICLSTPLEMMPPKACATINILRNKTSIICLYHKIDYLDA